MAWALLLTIGLSAAAGAETAGFRNVYRLDAEYELDRFMGDFPWEWRDPFWDAANAFRITGGSLNIRHFYIRQNLKARFPLAEDRAWFRFSYDKHLGLERDDAGAQLELEGRPAGDFYLSLVGEPTFHKADTDIGAALRWGPSEGRGVKFIYLWQDFDANYAYHNKSTSEGEETYYRRFPQEARLAGVWTGDVLSARLEGRLARPWEREELILTIPAAQRVVRGASSEAAGELRGRIAPWGWAAEGEAWRERESAASSPADGNDGQTHRERYQSRFSAERALSTFWRARAGLGFVRQRGVTRVTDQPALMDGYRLHDRLWFFSLFRTAGRWEWEGQYLYDRQTRALRTGSSNETASRSDNRLKLAALARLSDGIGFRFITTWELDATESERPGGFDGGTIQFQTVF